MATITPYPKIGPTGWTTSLAEKADGAFADFMQTDQNQTPLISNSIASMPDIINRWYTDPIRLVNQLRDTIKSFLMAYYPEGVVVDVVSPATNLTFSGGQYTLTISITVTEGGVDYSMGYLIQQSGGAVEKIARYNNTGSLT